MAQKIKLSEFFGEDWPSIKHTKELFSKFDRPGQLPGKPSKIVEIKGGLMLTDATVAKINEFIVGRKINGRYGKQTAYEDGKRLINNLVLPAQEHEDSVKLLSRKLGY